jgi:hypothetical protein
MHPIILSKTPVLNLQDLHEKTILKYLYDASLNNPISFIQFCNVERHTFRVFCTQTTDIMKNGRTKTKDSNITVAPFVVSPCLVP